MPETKMFQGGTCERPYTVQTDTNNETKRTRHHRNMKHSLIIDPTLNKQV